MRFVTLVLVACYAYTYRRSCTCPAVARRSSCVDLPSRTAVRLARRRSVRSSQQGPLLTCWAQHRPARRRTDTLGAAGRRRTGRAKKNDAAAQDGTGRGRPGGVLCVVRVVWNPPPPPPQNLKKLTKQKIKTIMRGMKKREDQCVPEAKPIPEWEEVEEEVLSVKVNGEEISG